MRFIYKIIITILLLLLFLQTKSQTDSATVYSLMFKELEKKWGEIRTMSVDSIEKTLQKFESYAKKAKSDSLLVNVFYKYSTFYLSNVPNKYLALHYNMLANHYTVKTNMKPRKMYWYNINIGNVFYNFGLYEQAIETYTAQYKYADSIYDNYYYSVALNNVGMCYRELNQFDKARTYFYKALNLRKEMNSVLIAHDYMYLISTYLCERNYNKAVLFFDSIKSELNRNFEDKVFAQKYNKYDFNQLQNEIWYNVHSFQGKIFEVQNIPDSIEYHYYKALFYAEQSKGIFMQAASFQNLGRYFFSVNKSQQGVDYMELALKKYTQLSNNDSIASIFLFLSKNIKNDSQKAAKYAKLHNETMNMINETNNNQRAFQKLIYSQWKLSKENIQQLENEKNLVEKIAQKGKLIISIISFFLIIILVLTFLLYFYSRKLNKSNRFLVRKNQNYIAILQQMQQIKEKNYIEEITREENSTSTTETEELKPEYISIQNIEADKPNISKTETIENEKRNVKYEQIIEQIIHLLEHKKIYKDTNLSIFTLADQLNVNKTYISEAVNNVLHIRLNDFINEFRINELLKLFQNEEYKKYSIDSIYKEVGFVSKGTFYQYFKQVTGVTPAYYLKNLNQDSES